MHLVYSDTTQFLQLKLRHKSNNNSELLQVSAGHRHTGLNFHLLLLRDTDSNSRLQLIRNLWKLPLFMTSVFINKRHRDMSALFTGGGITQTDRGQASNSSIKHLFLLPAKRAKKWSCSSPLIFLITHTGTLFLTAGRVVLKTWTSGHFSPPTGAWSRNAQ